MIRATLHSFLDIVCTISFCVSNESLYFSLTNHMYSCFSKNMKIKTFIRFNFLNIHMSLNIKGLVINYRRWATKREGDGASEVLHIQKGMAEQVLAMLKGGHNKL